MDQRLLLLIDEYLGVGTAVISRIALGMKERHLTLSLSVKSLLPMKKLEELRQALIGLGYFLQVTLDFSYEGIDEEPVEQVVDIFLQGFRIDVAKLAPAVAVWLGRSPLVFDHERRTIKLVLDDAMIYQTIQEKGIEKRFNDFFSNHGYPLNVPGAYEMSIVYDETATNSCYEQIMEEREQEITSMIDRISKGAGAAGGPSGNGAGGAGSNGSGSSSNGANGSKGNGGFGGNGGGGQKQGGFQRREGSAGNGGSGGKDKVKDERVIYRNLIKNPPVPIKELKEEESMYSIEGQLFEKDLRDLKTGKGLLSFSLTDFTYSIGVKLFAKEEEKAALFEALSVGKWYKVEGMLRYDTFEKEHAIYANNINIGEDRPPRKDNAEEKRVELHLHTTMSEMDGMSSAKSLVKTAIKWGHEAIAITDHGVLQAFPEAMETAGKDIKVLYGMEGYLANDVNDLVKGANDLGFDQTFVVFDIETTGLSPKNDRLTEIGAVKISGGEIVDRYSTFVNPQKPIPLEVTELTQITDEMVKYAPLIGEVLPEFLSFCGDAVMVAHNASFDMSFIRENCIQQGIEYRPIVLDTLMLSRQLLKELKRHRLNLVAKHFGINLEQHHRAVYDAEATAEILRRFFAILEERGITTLSGINSLMADSELKNLELFHCIIMVKNYDGLKDLYKLVSESCMHHFFKKPRVLKSKLAKIRQNMILGSACEAGELFKAILEKRTQEEIEDIAAFYDYLEIQPIGNNQFLVAKGLVRDDHELREINKAIVALGDKLGKPVVATCDVHFLNPEDEVFRRILMAGQGFDDAENQPPLYFRTTDEMLKEFTYLGKEKAYEVVVTNTRLIASMIDNIKPIPDETYPPIIEGSDEDLRRLCNEKAERIYGSPPPEIVTKRLDRELNSIISNGYAVMYMIAQKLVTKSLEDGYLVGSRGSVGSSFAATMCDITEVNPLPPHYVCEKCKRSEFIEDGSIGSGADLPDKMCPECGIPYIKDGHDIPFETFLGFEGDKEPDIDLNFAGVYQATSHKYTEELFGTGYVFKAGTIGTIADKTAYGYVKKYFEERGINVNSKEINRLTQGCTGVKRTTGQHPGGIMVVPNYKEIYDFCPIQYPANDGSSGVITTHFDYHSISGRILKLDILGHDVPTIIKQLEGLTGVDVQKIPLDDPQTVAIFTRTDTLKVVDDTYKCETGSLGIPEFGTKFVRQMLVDTQPSTFAELVRISGLSHGTDVWINNAQDLVRKGVAKLKDVISTRDDIMTYLIYQGLPPKQAFNIMERVRKGKGLTDENIELMKSFNVPDWYIWSCNTIKYMFPKAHAVAYVMMSFRIAYFKVHHPLAFYAGFFTSKVDDFDAQLISSGKEAIRRKKRELDAMSSESKLSKKDQDLYALLEVADEMYSRGFECAKVDLYKSDATQFMIEDGKLLPPMCSLQGVGGNAAVNIVEARGEKPFISIEDMKVRGKATKTVIEALQTHGCIDGLPENNQLTLFGLV